MNKNVVLKQIEEKLSPAVKNLENGNISEHDIFPSLLWLLLENSKELEKSGEIAKADVIERIGNLKQVSIADIENLLNKLFSQLLESNAGIEKSVTTTKTDVIERIGNLKQVSVEEIELILNKSIYATETKLLERVDNLRQSVSPANMKAIVAQENQKIHSLLKWLLGFCIIQFIGLSALVAIIFTR